MHKTRFFRVLFPVIYRLFIRYFVKEKKWFSYECLNTKIESLRLCGPEARDKPAFVNATTGKVSGGAVQMWVFTRLIPLMLGEKILNTNDPVWELILLLREIVELACAVNVTAEMIALMADKIGQYIEDRVRLFPDNKLKPKHFILHYPALTLECGPLIRLWTLRFESKKSTRSAQNFKNITQSLAVKHQLLQAYYSAGSLFGPGIEVKHAQPFHWDLFSAPIQEAVVKYPKLQNSGSTDVAESVTANNRSAKI